MARNALTEQPHGSSEKDEYALPTIWTMADLQTAEPPHIDWIIPGILPAGLTVLAGAPKLGKSFLVLNLAYSCAIGGMALDHAPAPQITVLYLALEDPPYRLRHRLDQMEAKETPHLLLSTEWPRGEKSRIQLHQVLLKHPDIRFVIIDTLARVRERDRPSTTSLYDADYGDIERLKKVADDEGIPILVVTHTRKADASDFLDQVSGSTGLTGAADTILLMRRARNARSALLEITGRDVEEAAYALEFDPDHGRWSLRGSADLLQPTLARQEIINYLREHPEPQKAGSIEEAIGKTKQNTGNLLRDMVKEGVICKPQHGCYCLP